MFVEDKKKLLTRVGIATLLVLAGITIGVVGVIAMLVRNQSAPSEEEIQEVRRKYITEYSKTEQARRGIDCRMLKTKLREFLGKEIRPVLDARRPGQGWSGSVSADLRKRMEEQQDYFFACRGLYETGRNGEWNGLQELGFSADLKLEFITMHTLIRFGEPRKGCDAACLDESFRDLQEAYKKIEARVR